ncbi:hypothetical protein [Candidatus Mycoplasma haematohominis]|uniref:Uncharacterized protein n=1 Tax=Candidatus Mycoplasma haematohominis TaxID=1494318 RepID=A0A478FQ05_9MOLU|nr:hypothetical protein [Candidatus Mycoplasma haemohominis]GCE63503.1 hypothetical protein MHSWG343_05000 [Candidatus Mycoplasma haemohominis]
MDPTKLAVGIGAAALVIGGGIGIKFAVSGKVVTLEGHKDYFGEGKGTKVGNKFASLLASTDDDVNVSFWSSRVHDLASKTPDITLATDGFFKDAKTDFETYRDELKKEKSAQTGIEEKAKKAIEKVKGKCKAKYGEDFTDTTISATDKPKWKEFWEFCSVEGVDKTESMVSSSQ